MFRQTTSSKLSQLPAWRQLLIFVLITLSSVFFCLLIGQFLGVLIFGSDFLQMVESVGQSSSVSVINATKYFQAISAIGLFLLPALVFAFFFSGNIVQFFDVKHSVKGRLVFLSILLLFAISPVINLLLDWNQSLKLPASLSGLENWMKSAETSAEIITRKFIETSSLKDLFVNVVLMAMLPAFSEEMVFRGIIQKILRQWTGKVHLSVWLAAAIFSFFHFQFYGFLPRLMLGALLGYLFVWTGNLLIPITVHFLNNFFSVVAGFWYTRFHLEGDYMELGNDSHPIVLVFSMILVIIIVRYFIINSAEKKSAGS